MTPSPVVVAHIPHILRNRSTRVPSRRSESAEKAASRNGDSVRLARSSMQVHNGRLAVRAIVAAFVCLGLATPACCGSIADAKTRSSSTTTTRAFAPAMTATTSAVSAPAGSHTQNGTSWTDVLTALGTVGAAVIALVLASWGAISRALFRPKLDLGLRHGSPDCQIIEVRRIPDNALLWLSLYVRLQVKNSGNRRARAVQLRITGLQRYDDTAGWRTDADFIPMYLTWANIGGTVLEGLQPGLPQHCDLCRFNQSRYPDFPLLEFITEADPHAVGPDRWPTKKRPGRYRATLAVTADNAKTVRRPVELDFTGEWRDDLDQMLTTGVRVNLIA